jgi:hypothetical protein
MKANGLCLRATLILIATLVPVRTLEQSQNSTDEIRELRKLVEVSLAFPRDEATANVPSGLKLS